MTNPALSAELIALAEADIRLRGELAASGAPAAGYHPAMRALHDRNAARLDGIIAETGWPSSGQVGPQAAAAAWSIVLHAVAQPDFQRRCLALLWQEADAGRVPPRQAAILEDRVRVFEGREQLYGTQVDWAEDGSIVPLPIEDADHVEERRDAVGLPSLAEDMAQRNQHRDPAAKPPADAAERRQRMEEWARSVGWR